MRANVIRLVGSTAFTLLLPALALGGCGNAESSGSGGGSGGSGVKLGSGGGSPVNLGSGGGTAASGGSTTAGGSAAGGASTTAGGSTTGGASTAGGASTTGGTNAAGSAAGGATTSSGGAACSAQTREGKRVPLDMYFLVDSSGSMADDVQGGNKWDLVTGALKGFLRAPQNADLGTGIGYFPSSPDTLGNECFRPSATCVCDFFGTCYSTDDSSCNVSSYTQPAVPLALTSNTSAIVNDLESRWVEGSTPTRPALEGAMQYLNGWASQHPERKSVLVLTTDGEPTECDPNTPDDVAAVAAGALAGPHAIQTFVIGVGDSLSDLDLVARAGGTERAFLVDTNANVATAFSNALDKIRGTAASCDFTIPTEGAAGQKIDPHQVNVRYTPTLGGGPTLVPQVYQNDSKNCSNSDGWYYDNPSAPSVIRLCDNTCRAMSGGSIAVEFGCETVIQQPR